MTSVMVRRDTSVGSILFLVSQVNSIFLFQKVMRGFKGIHATVRLSTSHYSIYRSLKKFKKKEKIEFTRLRGDLSTIATS